MLIRKLYLKINLPLFLVVILKIIFCTYAYPNKNKKRDLASVIYLAAGAKMSNYLKEFQAENKPFEDNRQIKEITFHNKDNLHVVQNTHKFLINLPRYLNSTIPAHDYYLGGITKDNVKLTEMENYAYNVSYSDKLVSNFPKPIIRYPKLSKDKKNPYNKKLDLEFELDQPDILPHFKSDFYFNLTNIVAINNLLIGTCYDNTLQLYHFYRLGIEELNVTDYFIEDSSNKNLFDIKNRKIKNIFLDSTSQINDRFILFIDSDDNILIYKINMILIHNDGYKHSFEPIVDLKDEKLKGKKIVDFARKENTFFLAVESEGIFIISKNNENNNYEIVNELKKFKCEKNNTEMNLDIKDIQEVGNSIYVSIAGFGLKILNIRDLKNVKFEAFEFRHPFIEKIEIHSNPNYNYFFLGVLISNRLFTSGDEFFLELSLEDEFEPKLTRTYLSDKVISVTNILNDDYFTYIFEKNSNKFLVISRSSTANEYNSVFEIYSNQLTGSSLVSNPFIFTDEFKFFKHIGILTNNNFIYSRSVELSSSEITFYFWEAGEYEVILYTYSDYCGESSSQIKMCKINLRYIFDVSMLPSNFVRIQDNSYYLIVGLFIAYNSLCLIVYRIKYAPNALFSQLKEDINDEYKINIDKTSRTSSNKDYGEQVIEMGN